MINLLLLQSIDPGQQFTWENSNLEINKPKNRYANVIAYDHSRVVLQTLEAVPGSDYINANFCDGYRKQNAYIATQVSDLLQFFYLFRLLIYLLMDHYFLFNPKKLHLSLYK